MVTETADSSDSILIFFATEKKDGYIFATSSIVYRKAEKLSELSDKLDNCLFDKAFRTDSFYLGRSGYCQYYHQIRLVTDKKQMIFCPLVRHKRHGVLVYQRFQPICPAESGRK